MIIDKVKSYIKAGLSIIPANIKTKQPAFELLPKDPESNSRVWTPFKKQIAEEKHINYWFKNDNYSVALICGKVSGNLEIIDIDNHFGDAEIICNQMKELVQNTLPGLFEKLTIETSQSNGYHWIYRCSKIEGNLKLAKRWKAENKQDTIIETRGEGGYALIEPSPNYTIIQGSLTEIQTISIEERNFLIEAAKSFDEIVDDVTTVLPEDYKQNISNERPGDEFNSRGDITNTLKEFGWKLLTTQGTKQYWKRPGKTDPGISATFNHIKDKFYPFSSNSYPFEPNKSYDKFAVETFLRYNKDFKESASQLLKQGYGKFTNGNGKKKLSDTTVNQEGKLGKKKHAIHFIEQYYEEHYNLRYNIVTALTEYQKKGDTEWYDVNDRFVNEVWRQFQKDGFDITMNKFENVLNSDFVKEYHPFKEYFNHLPEWDGEDHISQFINLVTVPNEQVGQWKKYFTKWIIGVVACATERGLNHCCIVFSGEQGEGKTTMVSKLIPAELKKYYAILQINPNDKDSKIAVTESFIINLDELESINRDEIGHLKSLMTIDHINIRRPYARRSETTPRRASFIGSVNKALFLTDITGNRRFLTVETTNIDLYTEIDINQLYAQALEMLNDGYQYWFDKQEIKEINDNNLRYQTVNPEDELLSEFFEMPNLAEYKSEEAQALFKNGIFSYLTVTEIYDMVQSQSKIKLSHWKLGQTLKNCGFKQELKRFGNRIRRVYLVKKIKKEGNDEEATF